MSRTLVVTNDFPPKKGGIENYVYELVKRFPPEEVVVFTSSADGDRSFDASLPFLVVRARTRTLLPTPHITAGAELLISQFDCDSVYFGAAAPLALMTPRLRRVTAAKRFVASTYGHECGWVKLAPGRAAIRRIGSAVDALTLISDFTGPIIGAALTPEARGRLVRLYPGVDPERYSSLPDPAPLRRGLDLEDRQVIVSLSRLVARKGQDTLIRTMPSVLTAVPGAALLIVGDGPYRPDLERLAAQLGVSGAVRFAGRVPDEELPQYYAAGQVFALPTRTRLGGFDVEGLGIVFLEAAAAGLPVIVGDSGGAPEAVRDGETGFQVSSTDVPGIAERLIELLSDPARAKAMGQAGRDWVRRDWTWEGPVETLRGLLR
ncbi:MAG: glycosyltransferase family 4 protein [Bifidobacteriaceae bacterium]|jgi:phosphatidylinositol alpha-1,6-mannosyltransferase|nr:glycosyltransferase family 4 protein [Bifidobacteriaceae bacterium]